LFRPNASRRHRYWILNEVIDPILILTSNQSC
jgi:hypothetical protein